jgi:hypothetical protein
MASDDDRDKYDAGQDAARRFEHAISRVLTVFVRRNSTKREAAYKKARRSKKTRHARAR